MLNWDNFVWYITDEFALHEEHALIGPARQKMHIYTIAATVN